MTQCPEVETEENKRINGLEVEIEKNNRTSFLEAEMEEKLCYQRRK